MSQFAIVIDDVFKSYFQGQEEVPVLKGVSASVAQGETCALLGPSGCGKTTFLNILSGIEPVNQGKVWLNDTEISALTAAQRTAFRRQHIGFVFQFFNLIPALTVEENVLLSIYLTKQPHLKSKCLSRLDDLGVGQYRNAYPRQLSGGQQQRVAIARAMAHEPSLILADEPTGNVDDSLSHQIIDLLIHAAQEAKSTLLVVTHSMEVAKKLRPTYYLQQGHLGVGE